MNKPRYIPFAPVIKTLAAMSARERESTLAVQSRLDIFVSDKNNAIQRFDIEANEAARQGVSTLTTFASVQLPIALIAFSQKEIMEHFNMTQRYVLVSTVALLLLSIFFGVLSHRSSNKFFKKWSSGFSKGLSEDNLDVGNMRSTKELYMRFDETLINDGLIKASKNRETISSNPIWDYFQIFTAATASILIVILLFSITIQSYS